MFDERRGRKPDERDPSEGGRAEGERAAAGPLFAVGSVLATPGALETLERAGENALRLLGRHATGDWGDLDDEDSRANDEALRGEGRLLSVYRLGSGEKVWIITEWDRSATTLLLPSEY